MCPKILMIISIISTFFLISCFEEQPLVIEEVFITKVSNPLKMYKNLASFVTIYGSGFDVNGSNTILFPPDNSSTSNSVTVGGDIMTVIIPENVSNGSISINVLGKSIESQSLNLEDIEYIEDIFEPLVSLDMIVMGLSPNTFDIIFTITDDTAVVRVISDEESNLYSEGIWVSGSYRINDLTFGSSLDITSGSDILISVVDIAGHTNKSNTMKIP